VAVAPRSKKKRDRGGVPPWGGILPSQATCPPAGGGGSNQEIPGKREEGKFNEKGGRPKSRGGWGGFSGVPFFKNKAREGEKKTGECLAWNQKPQSLEKKI